MNFDATYQGAVMRMQNGEMYTLREDGLFAFAGASYDYVVQVTLTGYTATGARGNIGYQTTYGEYIFLEDGWQKVGVRALAKYSQAQAQALVDKIIRNNKQILCNNLVCARFASKLTEEQQELVRDLQTRLNERNNALQSGGLCTAIESNYPAGYAESASYLDKLINREAIGVASWVVVVIAASVIAATATAAYFAYKEFAEESEQDIKYSKELMSVLASKLTEEEYQMLLNETKGIVTKARIKQAASSYSNALWIVAIICSSIFVYRTFTKKQ